MPHLHQLVGEVCGAHAIVMPIDTEMDWRGSRASTRIAIHGEGEGEDEGDFESLAREECLIGEFGG
jgi:hypothetical protein